MNSQNTKLSFQNIYFIDKQGNVVSTSLKLHNPADNIVITSTNQPDKTSIFVVIMHTKSSGP